MFQKKTKELNLAELIEYVIKYNITSKYFTSKNGYKVYFNEKSELLILCNQDVMSSSFPLSEVFEVEIIVFVYNLDTVIPRLLTMNVHGIYREHHYKSIKQLPFYKSYFEQYKDMYIINRDDTHTLLWSNGNIINNGEVYHEEEE